MLIVYNFYVWNVIISLGNAPIPS